MNGDADGPDEQVAGNDAEESGAPETLIDVLTGADVRATPKNRLVQQVLRQLIETYGFDRRDIRTNYHPTAKGKRQQKVDIIILRRGSTWRGRRRTVRDSTTSILSRLAATKTPLRELTREGTRRGIVGPGRIRARYTLGSIIEMACMPNPHVSGLRPRSTIRTRVATRRPPSPASQHGHGIAFHRFVKRRSQILVAGPLILRIGAATSFLTMRSTSMSMSLSSRASLRALDP